MTRLLSLCAIAATLACGARPPAVAPVLPHTTFTMASRVLGETRRINVYTPPGYDRGETRYPVLYMPDGGLAEDFPHLTRAVDTAIRAGEMRPVIVAGIENTERRRDMTGPTTVAEDRKIAPRVGGSAAFRAFLVGELRPELARRVRTSGETGIIGESLAGLFVVETLLLEPDAFDVYVALSPSLWWNGEALLHAAAERLAAQAAARPRTFLFALASDDYPEDAGVRLAAALRQAAPPSLRWTYEPMPQATHATIYRRAEAAVLRRAFPPSR